MTDHLNDSDLLQVLQAVDDSELLTDQQYSHLDTCEKCQQRLASLSGEGNWLSELQELCAETGENAFSESIWDEQPFEIGSSRSRTFVIDGSSSELDCQGIEASKLKLDFLDQPRHPELLGRLGRYDVERLIGIGGFGIVLKAFDSELNRPVALKVLAPHLMTSAAARARFSREAQAAAAIQHENVLPIFDVVENDDVTYLVMQFVSGASLQERVDRQGPLSTEEILRIAIQVAAGLAAAHRQGVVHRDVKPANILLESSLERVIVSDFGLAQTADDASLTRSGAITGTPHYMSPEQSRGETVDERSDLFSLGSLIYFMCVGHPPFRASQVVSVLHRICTENPRDVGAFRNDLPYELMDVVERLLEKNRQRRIASAGDVQDELEKILSKLQQGRLRARPGLRVSLRKFKKHPKRATWISLIAATGLAILMTPLVWGLINQYRERNRETLGNTESLAKTIREPEPPSKGANENRSTAISNPMLGLPADDFEQQWEETNERLTQIETQDIAEQNDVVSSFDQAWEKERSRINALFIDAESSFPELGVSFRKLEDEADAEQKE